jgi:hypothetical protein
MSGITTCPKCRGDLRGAHHVQEKTLICPHGFVSLSPPSLDLGEGGPSSRDLRLGLGWGYRVLLLLIGLVVLGITGTTLAVPRERFWLNDRSLLLFVEFALLAVLVIIASVKPITRWLATVRYADTWAILFLWLLVGAAFSVLIVFLGVCSVLK